MNIANDVSQAQISSTPSPAAPASAPSRSTAGVGAAAASSGVASGAPAAASAAHDSDQATLSSASGALTGSDVRTAKVASLQASINAGTYNVPASSVADKILSSLLGS